MNQSKHLFFIALLPPQDIQDQATEIKEYFAQNYKSKHALKSPPHITLQPPFEWSLDEVSVLAECLRTFAQTQIPIPITLQGFGAFVPRVIYINVLKTPELLAVQKNLMTYLEESLEIVHQVSKTRPFSPHMTVAFSDLTRQNFRTAWNEFEHREFEHEFLVRHLTLLIHNGKQWTIHAEFPFYVD